MGRLHDEPMFLDSGTTYRVRTFGGDFVNFTSTFVYYILLATIGTAAHTVDRVFRTRLFDSFVTVIERIDHGKETVIDGPSAPTVPTDTGPTDTAPIDTVPTDTAERAS